MCKIVQVSNMPATANKSDRPAAGIARDAPCGASRRLRRRPRKRSSASPASTLARRTRTAAAAGRIASLESGNSTTPKILRRTPIASSVPPCRVAAVPQTNLCQQPPCTAERIRQRLTGRKGHFMKAGLLASQFEALEAPEASEDVLTIETSQSPTTVVASIARACRG